MDKEEKCLIFKTYDHGIEYHTKIYYSENKFENAIRKEYTSILQELNKIPHIQSILANVIPYIKGGYYINCIFVEITQQLESDAGMGNIDFNNVSKYDGVYITLNQAVKHITIKEMNLIL